MLHRRLNNPLLTRLNIPGIRPELREVSSVFNPGAGRVDSVTHLLLRVQNRGRETYLLHAKSVNGFNYTVSPEPSAILGLDALGCQVFHAYDARITILQDSIYVTLSLDTDNGSRTILTKTDDFQTMTFVAQLFDGDSRNGVLFPERIGDNYLALVRPNSVVSGQVLSGSEIWLTVSDNLTDWQPVQAIMNGRPRFWDELIGPGTPPVKTREGWLHIYHGVATHFQSANIYQAGVVLLRLDDPSQVIARGRYNILEPRELYELVGQVPNVVFPTGVIVDGYDPDGYAQLDSRVTVYYGAADTVVATAVTTIADLLDSCHAGSRD